MRKRKHRLIIDTNLLISFLLKSNIVKFDKIVEQGNFVLLFSKELLEEFIEVTKRPKFKKYFSANDVTHLLETISYYIELVEVTSSMQICRDTKDDFLLELANDGKATHLLTGDKDLLDIKKIGKTKILTIAEYTAKHRD